MPEITISEFLLSVRNLLNLAYIVESDTVRIIKRQDLLFKSPAIDITDSVVDNPVMVSITTDGAKLEWEVDSNDDLWGEDYFKNLDDYLDFVKTPLNTVAELEALIPAENEIRYVAGVNLYFRYVYFAYDPEDDTLFRWQWVSWSYNFQNYRCGNVEDVFTNSFAPMLEIISRHTSGEVSGMQRGPFVSQKGAINSNGTMPSFAPRLMFYRGLTPDSLGANYPYLTNDNLDRVGTVIPGKCLALRFEGQYGIFEQLWSKYMTWYLTRKQVTWIIQDPSQLSFNQKYSINGNHYLLKSRSIGMSVNSINPEECQFYLV